MVEQNQFTVAEGIVEIPLSGEKLDQETNNLDLVAKVGEKLYRANRDFIKEEVKDNWFVVIEPMSGILFASPEQVQVFEYAKKKFPSRLFYSVGLLKENRVFVAE